MISCKWIKSRVNENGTFSVFTVNFENQKSIWSPWKWVSVKNTNLGELLFWVTFINFSYFCITLFYVPIFDSSSFFLLTRFHNSPRGCWFSMQKNLNHYFNLTSVCSSISPFLTLLCFIMLIFPAQSTYQSGAWRGKVIGTTIAKM